MIKIKTNILVVLNTGKITLTSAWRDLNGTFKKLWKKVFNALKKINNEIKKKINDILIF